MKISVDVKGKTDKLKGFREAVDAGVPEIEALKKDVSSLWSTIDAFDVELSLEFYLRQVEAFAMEFPTIGFEKGDMKYNS